MYERYFKRFIDITLSSLLLILLIPIFLFLYLLVKLDSKGPFLFIQPRVGKGQKLFRIYKLRTMTNEASLASLDPKITYQTVEGSDDVRITRIGKFLRKSHVDEFPQFLNVLRGDMSLIGVRPDAPSQESDYPEAVWRRRHLKRPGITGLVQLKPYATIEKNARLDLFYACTRVTFCFDFYIVIKTLIKIVRKRSF